MDNDSTTISRIKATVDNSISKRSDRNHTRKGFTGSLYELSNTHKALKNSKLRNHIGKCFTYCISQNRNQPVELASGLRNIVPHLFGKRARYKQMHVFITYFHWYPCHITHDIFMSPLQRGDILFLSIFLFFFLFFLFLFFFIQILSRP